MVKLILFIVMLSSAVANPTFVLPQELHSGSQDVGNVCPDTRTSCASTSTCCAIGSGYGCCSLENAVCCGNERCCPEGHVCDDSKGVCRKASLHAVEIKCPDGGECKGDQTCCETASTAGSYGCCPLPSAVCCSDGVHCCPEGETCDEREGKYLKSSSTKIMPLKEIQAVPLVKMAATSSVIKDDYNVCPNNKVKCTVGRCCAVSGSGKDTEYMCCNLPYSNSQCCSPSFRHCCPSGYHCVRGKDTSINCEKSDSTVMTWYDQTKGLL